MPIPILYKSGHEPDLNLPQGTYQEVSLDGHHVRNPQTATITTRTPRLPHPRDPNRRWVRITTKPA